MIGTTEQDAWDSLVTILESLKVGGSNVDAFANSVNTEKIKLLSSDFEPHEFPAIQMYDLGETCQPAQQGENQCDWRVRIEIVLKNTSTFLIDQASLRQYKHIVERAIGSQVQLGVKKIIRVDYVTGITDPHIVDDLYIAQLDFVIRYFKGYTREC